tara:strand:- start:457 stop:897 length:441 start_codon:yes stop_codon:yes gene_type:complete
MAQGQAFKVPKVVDGQIVQEYKYKNEDGELITSTKVIVDSAEPDWAALIGQEVMNLIESGELELPSAAVNLRIEDLTSSLTNGQYTYSLDPAAAAGKISIYLNGLNVTADTTLASDGLSFTVDSEYPTDFFEDSTLLVHYVPIVED